MKHLYFILFFLLVKNTVSSQTWQSLGPSENTYEHPNGLYTSLALSKTGQLYVAFQDNNNSNKCSVITNLNGSWTLLGSSLSSSAAYFTDIALNSASIPYVAFVDGSLDNKLSVKKYNGSSWEAVGSLGFSPGAVGYTNIIISPADEPYVCYIDGFNNDKITVKKFDGTNWVTVGTEGFSIGAVQYPKIAFSTSGELYAVYQDVFISSRIRVRKFIEGSGWGSVGSVVSSGVGDYPDIAIDDTGTPIVSYWSSASKEVVVKKWQSNNWLNQGTISTFNNSVRGAILKLSKYNTPYLLVVGSQENLIFKKDSLATTWSNHSSFSFNGGNAEYGDIAFWENQLWCTLSSSNAKLSIVKNTATGWDNFITTNSLDGASGNGFPLLSFDRVGNPFTAFYDANQGTTIVKSYIGGAWITSSSYQNAPFDELVGFEIAQTNSLKYLVYENISTYPSTFQVVRQSNSVWSNFGTTVSGEKFRGLKVNGKGEIYLILENGIKKYQSGIWSDIAVNSDIKSYAFDSAGNIWALFNDTNAGLYKIKKYLSGVWTDVASLYYSYYNPKFTLNANNEIFVISGSPLDQGVFAFKYADSHWQMLGSFIYSFDLYESFDGIIPYNIFIGSDNSIYSYVSADKINAYKLVNNQWTNLGVISSNNSMYGVAALNKNNNLIALYRSYHGLYSKVYGDYIVLPVTLLNYAVSKTSTSVQLNWSTSTEQNNDYYLVEKSSNGTDFSELGKVSSKGNTSVLSAYNFSDLSPSNGINYYRLTQVDKDGTKTVLGIKEINFEISQAQAVIYPNPIEGTSCTITVPNANQKTALVKIADLMGKQVFSGNVNIDGNKLSVNLTTKPGSGIYLVYVDGFQPIKLVVK